MLSLINRDRAAVGLTPVAWDEAAALTAQSHAGEMARFGYMSHWNLDGHGPSHRYSQAGGLDAAQENVYMYRYRYDDGQPALIENWEDIIHQAQIDLMNSPGHRANILRPEHTHVGIGMAYNADTGDFRLAQLFVNHYIRLTPLPTRVALNQPITLQGQLDPRVSHPLLNLAYEPFPKPMSVAELNSTSSFASRAQIYDTSSLQAQGDGQFQHSLTLDYEGRAGLYSIRLWVDGEHGQILATEIVIEVW